MTPTAFATPFDQWGQYRSFQGGGHANVQSGTMSDAIAIVGGSKPPFVASRTSGAWLRATTSSRSTSYPPSFSPPSSHSPHVALLNEILHDAPGLFQAGTIERRELGQEQ